VLFQGYGGRFGRSSIPLLNVDDRHTVLIRLKRRPLLWAFAEVGKEQFITNQKGGQTTPMGGVSLFLMGLLWGEVGGKEDGGVKRSEEVFAGGIGG